MKKMTWTNLPGKKLTLEIVRKKFYEKGYTLLATKYRNAHERLEYICPEGHKHSISWNSFQQGSRCRVCKYLNHLGKTQSYEFIKNDFAQKGYKLLSTNYISGQKLTYKCPKGHIHSVLWNNWNNGYRCPYCNEESRKKKIFQKVKESFRKEKCILLSKEYLGARSKLEYICPNAHESFTTWNDWQTGYRCHWCKVESMIGSGNPRYHKGENIIGESNPNWRGGIAGESYCPVWKEKQFINYINERDKDKFCWNPLCNHKGNKRVRHHMDYNKKNCDPQNIITICNSCNSRANFNRKWWTEFYSTLMQERFSFRKAAGL